MFANTLAWNPEKPALTIARNAAVVLLSSLALGLLGQISIPLPFTPIPIVIQVQAALLLGALLGSRRASAAVFAFLVQGALGLPVFAGGAFGLAALLGPSGGYLIGYMVGAYVVGAVLERVRQKTLLKAFWAITLGNSIVYLLGAGYLSLFVGYKNAILLGVAPFVLGCLLKNIACVKILQWIGWER